MNEYEVLKTWDDANESKLFELHFGIKYPKKITKLDASWFAISSH